MLTSIQQEVKVRCHCRGLLLRRRVIVLVIDLSGLTQVRPSLVLHFLLRLVVHLLSAKLGIFALIFWERRARDATALVPPAISRLVKVTALTIRVVLAHVLRHALLIPNAGVRRRDLRAQYGRIGTVEVEVLACVLDLYRLLIVVLGCSRVWHSQVLLLISKVHLLLH